MHAVDRRTDDLVRVSGFAGNSLPNFDPENQCEFDGRLRVPFYEWDAARFSISKVVKGLPMATGTVKWFNIQKGFGFIQPDNGGAAAFVHISAVERAGLGTLNEGQKVEFELVADRRSGKMAADNLKTIG